MKEPSTRFVIEVEGLKRLVFTVKEAENDELRLILKAGQRHINDDGTETDIVEQRYTLHRPRGGGTSVFKQTLVLADGRKGDTANTTLAIHESKFCVIYTRRCPTLANSRYISKNRANDDEVDLGFYHPNFNTFIYSVVISSPGVALPPGGPCFSVIAHDFKQFRISVVRSFMQVISHERHGDLVHAITSGMRWDNEPIPPLLHTTSQSADDVILGHLISTERLRVKFLERVREEVPPEVLAFVDHCSRMLTPVSSVILPVDENGVVVAYPPGLTLSGG